MTGQEVSTEKKETTNGQHLNAETAGALERLKIISGEVGKLDPMLRERAIALLLEKEFATSRQPSFVVTPTDRPSPPVVSEIEFASLVERWTPATGNQWALLAAYFLTKCRGQDIVTGQEVNSVLKHHGVGRGNITKSIARLIKAEPSLMLQVRKDGTSRQARKSYKVTTSGFTYVEERLSGKNEEGR